MMKILIIAIAVILSLSASAQINERITALRLKDVIDTTALKSAIPGKSTATLSNSMIVNDTITYNDTIIDCRLGSGSPSKKFNLKITDIIDTVSGNTWKTVPIEPTTAYEYQPPLDTVRVIMLLVDTTVTQFVFWEYGYSVRKKYTVQSMGVDGFFVHYPRDYWEHLYYLDDKKQPIRKNIIVWESIEIE